MTIKLFPYADSTGEIKYYTTDHIAINGKNLKEKTIYSNGLSVSAKASPNLSVNVASGQCSYNGKFLNSTTTVNVTISANTTNYNRYDLIVADLSSTGSIKVVTGSASSNPTIPTAGSNQIVLAKVLVGSNVSSIQANNITDLRFSTSGQYKVESLDTSIHQLENKVSDLEANKSTRREYSGSGVVKSITIETNKEAKIKRQYLKCSLTAAEWKSAWENLNAGSSNHNGGIWIPFYDAVNTSNVIDATINFIGLNKWVWLSPGSSKIGQYGIGGIGSGGCYAFIENKFPNETTIGIDFTICIAEKY